MANNKHLDEIENQIANVTLIEQQSVEQQSVEQLVEQLEQQSVEQLVEQLEQQQSVEQQSDEKETLDELNDNHINPMIEGELIKTLTKFFNEIDLVFDYVDKGIVGKLEKFLKNLSNSSNMKIFVEETVPILKKYEENISKVIAKKRVRTAEFDFLNDIVLFKGLLKFDVFKDENKNTKSSLVKYLHTIYMSVFVLHFGMVSGDVDSLTHHLSGFVKGIQDRISEEQLLSQQQLSKKLSKKDKRTNVKSSGANFGNLMESLMQNNDIMNLATDLSKDIQSQNLDPMMLLSSIMSGKPNETIQNLVSNITNKIESKINNGEIDKGMLEQQAQSIMNTVQNSNGDIQKMFGGLD